MSVSAHELYAIVSLFGEDLVRDMFIDLGGDKRFARSEPRSELEVSIVGRLLEARYDAEISRKPF